MAVDLTGKTARLRWRKSLAHQNRHHILEQPRKMALSGQSFLLIVSLHITGMTRRGHIFGVIPIHVSPRHLFIFDNLELAWDWKEGHKYHIRKPS